MKLHDLKPNEGSKKDRKRVGRMARLQVRVKLPAEVPRGRERVQEAVHVFITRAAICPFTAGFLSYVVKALPLSIGSSITK
jgi:hypothetical protein